MQKRIVKQNLSLIKSAISEALVAPCDAAATTILKNASGAESPVAPAQSDTGATTSPVKRDAIGNPELPDQTIDPQPSASEPGTSTPASPPNEASETGAMNIEADAEREAPATPSDPPENNPPLTTGGKGKPSADLDDGCFEPFIPKVVKSPEPKPVPQPPRNILGDLVDEVLRKNGIKPYPTPAPMETETELPASAPAEAEIVQPSEIFAAPVEAEPAPPRVATAVEIFGWIKQCVLAKTCLPEDAAEFVCFWIITTWCQDSLSDLPCLVITGPAHEARVVLHLLRAFCRRAVLVNGFRRKDLGVLRESSRTILISEPNLDRRTAALLSNLTDPKFSVVDRSWIQRYSMSMAIYAGESPRAHAIQNSIQIHISPTNLAPLAPPPWLGKMMNRIPVHLDQYRERNLDYLREWTWVPPRVPGVYAVSRETDAIATALGHGLVDAPELRQKLLVLLKTQDRQRLSEKSNTLEAVVIEALLAFSRDGREHASCGEIADEVNCLLEVRRETVRLNPERVGHRLKNLDLPTRRLSKSANGLVFDKVTIARIHELAAVYMVEDAPVATENLHRTQATETK